MILKQNIVGENKNNQKDWQYHAEGTTVGRLPQLTYFYPSGKSNQEQYGMILLISEWESNNQILKGRRIILFQSSIP